MNINDLNVMQKEAVITTEGPVMVMAGAGSGKTRVLTYRIAYLIEELSINPSSILAVTFTNKAAREMKERVSKLLDMNVDHLWVSTFHSFCARFLRREIGVLNIYRNNFTIIDDDDSLKIIKEITKDNEIGFSPKEIQGLISRVKNEESLPENISLDEKEFKQIFEIYQKRLIKDNLLDFDDLILLTVRILEDYLPVREKYGMKFNYIMIDEFQDTNNLQYKLINLLASVHQNIFIVGDINQSIYSFRGAKVENVTLFKKLYNPKIIKLEENYRSTKQILDIANDVISKNNSFINMQLFTSNEDGPKAVYFHADSSYGETIYVINEIKKLVRNGVSYKDIAILYRLNSLSLSFENEFVKHKIPYVIYGGVGYYERKEVKDIISYLRLIINHNDDFSFRRIVNEPKRKIGDKLIENLSDSALVNNCSLFEAIDYLNNSSLKTFKDMILKLSDLVDKISLVDLIENILEETTYLQMLKAKNEDDRIDNILELKSIMKDISENYTGTNFEKLETFLLDLALKTDTDNQVESSEKVKLMSFHQAKGLEYEIVFMIAMEQGIFPSYRSLSYSFELEEERRICYVGITRAKRKLYFTDAHVRRLYGKDNVSFPSQFMKDIKRHRLDISGYGVYNTKFEQKDVDKKGKEDDGIKTGSKIMHKVFGKGIVICSDGDTITVAFSSEYGVKKLLANHPSITKI